MSDAACEALTAAERRTLSAAMDRILPDGDGPGATTANAIGYVDWLTSQASFRAHLATMRNGIALLDSIAEAIAGTTFVECDQLRRDTTLLRVQEIPHAAVQRFFESLVSITLAGFLCPIAYGGNRGGIGWAHIGFSMPSSRSAVTAPSDPTVLCGT